MRAPEQLPLLVDGSNGARFSPCRRYRFLLWRSWDNQRPVIVWILHNPSVADESRPDRTVASCCRRSRDWGFGGLRIVNLFAWVSTHPADLAMATDPVGPENDAYMADALVGAAMVVCGWGQVHHQHAPRAAHALSLIRASGLQPMALRQNADGSPAHPLRLRTTLKPRPFA